MCCSADNACSGGAVRFLDGACCRLVLAETDIFAARQNQSIARKYRHGGKYRVIQASFGHGMGLFRTDRACGKHNR